MSVYLVYNEHTDAILGIAKTFELGEEIIRLYGDEDCRIEEYKIYEGIEYDN